MTSLRSSATVAFSALAALLLGVTGVAIHYRGVRAGDRELLQDGLKRIGRNVRDADRNLREIIALSDASMLAKTRAFARLVHADRTFLTNQSKLERLAAALDVDELHVSDEKGVLVACVPESYKGYRMDSKDQSRAFMPAIDNPQFELVQIPMPKGSDSGLFQYSGVARLDAPGIVQIGASAKRVADARKLADVEEVVRNAHIGRDGREATVRIMPAEGAGTDSERLRIDRIDGVRSYVLASRVGAHRIQVAMPLAGPWLADDVPFSALVVGDILYLIVLLFVCSPYLRETFLEGCQTLSFMFSKTRETTSVGENAVSAFRHAVRSPLTIACLLVFLAAIGIAWAVMSSNARVQAEDRLLAAAGDVRTSVENCVDLPLFYVGNAICKHYGSPEAMTTNDVAEVMRRYDIDEVNVIDSRGIVIAGAIADIGYDMASNPKSAEFNCLLEGVATYSQAFRGAIENPSLRRKYIGVAFPPPAKGYIQLGFSEERVRNGIDYWFEDLAVGWHIGETGFYVIAKSEDGRIDSCGKSGIRSGDTLAAIGFDAAAAPKSPNVFFEATLDGEPCLCLTEEISFHRVISAIPLKEINGGWVRMLIVLAFILTCVFTLVVFFMTRLTDLVTSLKGYIADEKHRQEKEFSLARTIQVSSLPGIFPDTPDHRIFAKMVTAKEVGGDFYDFYPVPDGRRLVLVADVSGKGISAAMFMMKARTIIKASIFMIGDLAEAVAEANNRLAENNDANMFVTAWIGLFDPKTGEIEYVNAGHNPPLVRRQDGAVEWIRGRPSLTLAAMDGVPYHSGRLKLGAGDSLFLYTDGVTEAMNPAGELYGEGRLEATLKLAKEDLIALVYRDLHAFVSGAEQSDDITMLTLDFKGGANH